MNCVKCGIDLPRFTNVVNTEFGVYCETCFFDDALEKLGAKSCKVSYEGDSLEEQDCEDS